MRNEGYMDVVARHGLAAPRIELLRNGVVNLTGPIDQHSARQAMDELMLIEREYPGKPVTLYIMSPGGEVSSGFALLDVCRRLNAEVSTVALGLCASMAAVLACCCAPKGRRFIAPNAELMVHQPLGQAGGQASDIVIASDHIKATKARLEELLSDATGLGRERIAELCDRDTYLTATRAVELGFADRVLDWRKNDGE